MNQFWIQPTPISMQGIRGIGTGLARKQQRDRLDRGRQMMKAATASGDEEMLANVMMDFPELAQSFGQAMKFKNERTKANALVGLRQILANPERAGEVLRNRIQVVAAEGGDPTDTAMELTEYHEDPEGYVNNLRMQYGGIAPKQEFEAHQKTVAGGPGGMVSAKTEIMDDGTTVQVRPSGEVVVTDPSGNPVTGQKRLNVLQKARDTGILIKQREADVAVNQARRTAAATRGAELKKDLKHKPAVMRAVKLAQKEAADRGEALSDLNRMQAGMPGLEATVGDLKKLAPLATHTMAGKVFNGMVRELGFGATKGATARARFISLIDNQVLPLLRETFGAAFTAQEGERLRKTMADEDASPEEKMVQLETFIEQKRRNIESAEKRVEDSMGDGQSGQGQVINFDAQGNPIQ